MVTTVTIAAMVTRDPTRKCMLNIFEFLFQLLQVINRKEIPKIFFKQIKIIVQKSSETTNIKYK